MRRKTNPEEYKNHRREKGRIAQRAFRQRQIDTINKLEQEVALLRDSIRKICRAAKDSSLDEKSFSLYSLPLQPQPQQTESELLKAICHAGKVAGVDEEESSSMSDEHDTGSNQNNSSEQSSDHVGDQTHTNDVLTEPDDWWFPNVSRPTSIPFDQKGKSPLRHPGSDISSHMPPQIGEFNYFPRSNDMNTTTLPEESGHPQSWDQNLSLDKFDPLFPQTPLRRSLTPKYLPFHIIPYMDRDADTFAGRIFWKSLSLAFQFGIASLTPTQQQKSSLPGLTHISTPTSTQADKMLGHTSALIGREQILRRIGARLEYRKTGSVDSDSPLWDGNATMHLRVLVEEDLQRRGENMSDWLRISDIVDYISSRCGMSSFAQLDTLGGSGLELDGDSGGLVTRLIEDIALNGVCFGDGPRYRAREVKRVIDEWVNALTW